MAKRDYTVRQVDWTPARIEAMAQHYARYYERDQRGIPNPSTTGQADVERRAAYGELLATLGLPERTECFWLHPDVETREKALRASGALFHPSPRAKR